MCSCFTGPCGGDKGQWHHKILQGVVYTVTAVLSHFPTADQSLSEENSLQPLSVHYYSTQYVAHMFNTHFIVLII